MLKDLNTDFTLDNCLFAALKLTENADLTNMNIVVMVLDLMSVDNFHYQMVAGAKISLLL